MPQIFLHRQDQGLTWVGPSQMGVGTDSPFCLKTQEHTATPDTLQHRNSPAPPTEAHQASKIPNHPSFMNSGETPPNFILPSA